MIHLIGSIQKPKKISVGFEILPKDLNESLNLWISKAPEKSDKIW